jgi:hypothetical protein
MPVIDSVKEDARNSFKPLETRENKDQTQWSEFSGLRRGIKNNSQPCSVGCCFFEGKGQREKGRVQSAECRVKEAFRAELKKHT